MAILKLISEIAPFEGIQIQEQEVNENKKDLYIQGIFIQAEKANKNNRIYKESIVDREVKKYTEQYINQSNAMGELNHPPRPSVDPKEASHLITELKKSGHDYIGKAKVLSGPVGLIVKSLISDGVKLGVSTRGLGSLKEGTGDHEGLKIVQEDYKLITVDIVSDPSAPDAWVNGIFESVDYIMENGMLTAYDAKAIQKARDKQHKILKEASSEIERLGVASKLIDLISSFKSMEI